MPEEHTLTDVVLHPVRLRILQQLGGRDLTTTELRTALPQVSQPTLYRHVAALIDAGIVVVAKERRVRGALERTLTLRARMAHVGNAELRVMDDDRLREAFLAFLDDLAERFGRFITRDEAGSRDFLGFGPRPLHVNTSDLEKIQAGLNELLEPYLTDRKDGRRRVILTTTLIPDS